MFVCICIALTSGAEAWYLTAKRLGLPPPRRWPTFMATYAAVYVAGDSDESQAFQGSQLLGGTGNLKNTSSFWGSPRLTHFPMDIWRCTKRKQPEMSVCLQCLCFFLKK